MADDAPREELTAYLDGELDQHVAAEVDRKLRDDPRLRREFEALKRTWELLDFLPQPEPSANFTSRTLDKLEVVLPSPSRSSPGTRSAVTPSPTATCVGPPPRVWPWRVTLAAAAALAFLIGYGLPGPFFKKGPKALSLEEREEQMARDLRVIDHLTLYQAGGDMTFVNGLDQPDLFGE